MIAYKVTFNNKSTNTQGKYKLSYSLGKITKSVQGSIGIMCFNSFDMARRYLNTTLNCIDINNYNIYEVFGINKKNTPYIISPPIEPYINQYYKDITIFQQNFISWSVPCDTICFESVKLLKKWL